ncbi:hypothetical protein O6H91_11G078200 [Diphasiastrum complanatum]|nr:hypothetical protein O6H91_11G078200 [Diphasiastrum complanatum]
MQEANYDIQMQGTMTKMEYYGYPVDEVDIHVNLAPLSKFQGLSVCATISKIFLEGTISNGLEIPLPFCTSPSRVNVVLNEWEATLVLKLPVIPYRIAHFVRQCSP